MGDDAAAYMLDTNVFNGLIEGKFSLGIFGQHRLIATGIQRDELGKTRDVARRAKLLERFDTVNVALVPVASFALDIEGAGLGQAFWNDGSGTVEWMRQRLQELDRARNKRRKKEPLNQERDILIAETALKAGAVLISSDKNLCCVMKECGGEAEDPLHLEGEGPRPH